MTGTAVRPMRITAERGGRARAIGLSAVRVLLPVVIALVVGAVAIALTGNDPLAVYGLLLQQSFGSVPNLDATLAAATPLLFSAVGAAFAYRAGVFSVGVEGSFVAGGLVAAVVGSRVGALPAPIAIAIVLLAGGAAGVLVAAVPAVLRARLGVDEVVTTLMVNFIVTGITGWLVVAYLQVRGQGNTATADVALSAQLPHFGDGALTNLGLPIGVVLLVVYWLFLQRTPLGFEFRAVGTAPRFALAQGLRVRTVIVVALLGAGFIGGVGGAAHTSGDVLRFTGGFSAGYGFTGIAIALIARFNPIGILVGAVLFGALASAGTTAQLFMNLPIQLVQLLQGTVMLFAVTTIGIPMWLRRRRARKGVDA